MRILLFFILAFLVSSCVIRINDNAYRDLHKDQLQSLKPFSLDETDAVCNQAAHLRLVEITGDDINKCLQKYPYTIVHFWRPYCKAPSCKPLFYYEHLEKKFRDKGVKLLMVSETYDYKLIKENAERCAYDRDLYIIKDSVYGHKHKKAHKRVGEEITVSYKKDKPVLFLEDCFIFKKDDLVYHGDEVSEKIVDSVLKNN